MQHDSTSEYSCFEDLHQIFYPFVAIQYLLEGTYAVTLVYVRLCVCV